ncbi:LysR family transcriptional regulator [Pelagibius sp. Alg239-R121]|uniref:LysR family transcriptional regulator n=1 Tax=Pelagibius sp. Alg239-R121 TaxID=2993448 RepID=UPI0024A78604|nr:LysR family transcriptional regulator [Pelagibius sp. Alg239-R121]
MSFTRIPSLNWLRVFESAARTESFARAAELLNMSPPAVSQQIKALESYLGKPLFERGPRSVTLTDAGKAFLPVVQQSFQSVETTAAALFGSRAREPLTVQASLMFACSWLAPRLSAFRAANPDVQLHLMTGNYNEDFRRPGADLRIVFGSGPDLNEEGELLFGETLYPVAIPKLAEVITSADDLLDHRLIEIASHRTGWFQLLQSLDQEDAAPPSDDEENGVMPEEPVSSQHSTAQHPRNGQKTARLKTADISFADTTQLALALAAEGYGIALARAPATDRLVRTFGLVPCALPPSAESGARSSRDSQRFSVQGTQSYYLTYPSASALRPAAELFRDWLRSEVEPLQSR